MKTLIVLLVSLCLIILSGCSVCQIKYPLDGKAQSWCRAKRVAHEYCGTDPEKDDAKILYLPHTMVRCDGGKK